MFCWYFLFFFSSRRRHTRCALVTGVQTCALPILIVSDYDAVKELTVHGVAADAAEAARMALHAGVDIDLHSGTYLEQLPKLVRDGKVPIAEVDAAVRRVLERSEEHTSELQSLMRISYAVFCLKKKKTATN